MHLVTGIKYRPINSQPRAQRAAQWGTTSTQHFIVAVLLNQFLKLFLEGIPLHTQESMEAS